MLRHGESEWNAQRRWQGQADPPLTDLGRSQAMAAAEKLGSFDLVATSDLQRAQETAAIIARALGSDVHLTLPELRETHVGEWEGLTHDEIDRRWPGHITAGLRPPSFETDESVIGRFVAGLGIIAGTCPGGSALAVAHGGLIRVMRRTYDLDDRRIANLGGCEFVLETGGSAGTALRIGDIVELVDHGEIAESL